MKRSIWRKISRHSVGVTGASMKKQNKIPNLLLLDSAILNERAEIVQCLMERGGMTLTRIQNISATRIQAWFRGNRIRNSFRENRQLLLK